MGQCIGALLGLSLVLWGLRHQLGDVEVLHLDRAKVRIDHTCSIANDRETALLFVKDWENEGQRHPPQIYVWCRPIPDPGRVVAGRAPRSYYEGIRVGSRDGSEVYRVYNWAVDYRNQWESLDLVVGVRDAPGWHDEHARVLVVTHGHYDKLGLTYTQVPLSLAAIALGSLIATCAWNAWCRSGGRHVRRLRVFAPLSVGITAGVFVSVATLALPSTAACLVLPWLAFGRVRSAPMA